MLSEKIFFDEDVRGHLMKGHPLCWPWLPHCLTLMGDLASLPCGWCAEPGWSHTPTALIAGHRWSYLDGALILSPRGRSLQSLLVWVRVSDRSVYICSSAGKKGAVKQSKCLCVGRKMPTCSFLRGSLREVQVPECLSWAYLTSQSLLHFILGKGLGAFPELREEAQDQEDEPTSQSEARLDLNRDCSHPLHSSQLSPVGRKFGGLDPSADLNWPHVVWTDSFMAQLSPGDIPEGSACTHPSLLCTVCLDTSLCFL